MAPTASPAQKPTMFPTNPVSSAPSRSPTAVPTLGDNSTLSAAPRTVMVAEGSGAIICVVALGLAVSMALHQKFQERRKKALALKAADQKTSEQISPLSGPPQPSVTSLQGPPLVGVYIQNGAPPSDPTLNGPPLNDTTLLGLPLPLEGKPPTLLGPPLGPLQPNDTSLKGPPLAGESALNGPPLDDLKLNGPALSGPILSPLPSGRLLPPISGPPLGDPLSNLAPQKESPRMPLTAFGGVPTEVMGPQQDDLIAAPMDVTAHSMGPPRSPCDQASANATNNPVVDDTTTNSGMRDEENTKDVNFERDNRGASTEVMGPPRDLTMGPSRGNEMRDDHIAAPMDAAAHQMGPPREHAAGSPRDQVSANAINDGEMRDEENAKELHFESEDGAVQQLLEFCSELPSQSPLIGPNGARTRGGKKRAIRGHGEKDSTKKSPKKRSKQKTAGKKVRTLKTATKAFKARSNRVEPGTGADSFLDESPIVVDSTSNSAISSSTRIDDAPALGSPRDQAAKDQSTRDDALIDRLLDAAGDRQRDPFKINEEIPGSTVHFDVGAEALAIEASGSASSEEVVTAGVTEETASPKVLKKGGGGKRLKKKKNKKLKSAANKLNSEVIITKAFKSPRKTPGAKEKKNEAL